EGVFNGSLTGSVKNWQIIAAAANNEHNHVTGAGGNTSVISASVSKMVSGKGGLVFYLGSHDYSTADVQNNNGIRMYMNAFLTPAVQVCPSMFLLPQSLTSFAGSFQNGQSQLQWTVTQNQTFDHFIVEKSTDGASYAAIGRVPATATNDLQSYFFNEPEVYAGTVYYRLRMAGKNNDMAYSPTILLKNNQPITQSRITSLPNPISSALTFTYTTAANSVNEISIYNTSGAKVFTTNMAAQKGANPVSLSLRQDIPRGIYLLEMVNSRERVTAKFVKQ
ncbi:MAG TPA: T9SS type A sorting domain-containing protein, partial [Chitinophagaceae bacterium]|nr:T9SS type A sorting domain-containing protein [Chitinophagaceae bacterium]